MTVVNAAQLIEFSQAVPFKCRQSTYLCFYCGVDFTEPDLLKTHTRLHRATNKEIVYSIKAKNDLVKVDVTCLDCKLCGWATSDLTSLKSHLINSHNKKFAEGVSDGILPYRLSDKLSCIICSKPFPFFHVLNAHMNEHFYFFVCEICGSGFATQTRLNSHAELHDIVNVPCHLCGKVFKQQHRLKLHIQLFHERKGNQICPRCPERFLDYHQKLKHLSKAHGVEPRSYPCEACGQVFTSRRRLTTHTQRDHMLQRRFQCTYCDKRFYASSVLKNHLAVHSRERNFECSDCGHSYSTRKILYDHIKRHHLPRT